MTWFNTTTSSLRNTTHTYTIAGTYSVTLYVRNAGGYNSTQKIGYINLVPDKIGVSNGYVWYIDRDGSGFYNPLTEQKFWGIPGYTTVIGKWQV